MGNFKILVLAVLAVVALLATNSCYDDEGVTSARLEKSIKPERGVVLKFGRYYGKCIGNTCVEIFSLQKNILLEDKLDNKPLPDVFYKGDFVKFKGSSNVDAQQVLKELPIQLLQTKSTFNKIGQPDAGDWGGIYIEYEDINQHKQFLIDLNTKNIPKYLRSYVYLIDEKVDEIGEINNQY